MKRDNWQRFRWLLQIACAFVLPALLIAGQSQFSATELRCGGCYASGFNERGQVTVVLNQPSGYQSLVWSAGSTTTLP